TGPDGSIFVLDYYRKIIEHPEWLSDEVIKSGDLYAGKDKGRLYRISPVGTAHMAFLDRLNLGDANTSTLIAYLADPNVWWRTQAQRLLMDRNETEIIKALKDFVLTTGSSVGKVHGIWLLESKGQMEEKILVKMLDDQEAGVRENAIKIAEGHLASSETLRNKLLEMVSDSHPKVRFQLLLTLGNLSDEKSSAVRNQLLFQDIEDPWVQYAALSAADLQPLTLFTQAATILNKQQTQETEAFFRKLSQLITRSGSHQELNRFLTEVLQAPSGSWFYPLVLEGIADGIEKNRDLTLSPANVDRLAANFNASTNPALRHQSLALLQATGFFKQQKNTLLQPAVHLIQQPEHEESMLADAVQVVGWSGSEAYFPLLQNLILTHNHPEIASTILHSMNTLSNSLATHFMVDQWSTFSPEERKTGIQIFFENNENRKVLMTAITEKKIQPSILTWGQTVSLLNSSDPSVRSLARESLHGNELNADTVWQAFQESLKLNGQIDAGREVFIKHCGICHQKSGDLGVAFGPDLSAVQNRTATSLMLDILQPNRSISDGYELWTISLKSGNSLSGIISQQSPTSITIRDATGKETTIDRNDIKELIASQWSAMPENLHTQFNQKEMADLLAFLKSS
ncbi:MAG: c-type cytochrome, partial [Saprospiraceae bacterium]|nr:c-type cytochrome [Saprospiraceae bacterium]